MQHLRAFIILGGLSVAGASLAQTTYSNYSLWNGSEAIQPFSNPDTSTYGQTFVAPVTDTMMDSYKFSLISNDNTPGIFKFYVSQWDTVNGHAIGAPVFESGILNSATGGNFVDYTVNVGVNLISGGNYVAFMSCSNVDRSVTFSDRQAWISSGSTYADGQFVYQNNGNDPTTWNSQTWNTGSGLDSTFEAKFSSPVPEPASIAALGLGMICLIRRRRK